MTRRARWAWVVGTVAVAVAAGVFLVGNRGGDGVPRGLRAVDYSELRVLVPESFFVQDIAGKVDGEPACPDADGFVFTGDNVPAPLEYTVVTCDPPGDELVVRIGPSSMTAPTPQLGAVREVNGVRYQRHRNQVVVHLDRPVLVVVHGPEREAQALARRIAATMRRSPAHGRSTPTAAPPRTAVTDRLADALGCVARDKATTYGRVNHGFAGRQKEAPVDCYASIGAFRILVLADRGARDAAQRYYDRVWLVVGDDWLLTAPHEDAARAASELVGGTLRPPPNGCCGPPTSDPLPGVRGP